MYNTKKIYYEDFFQSECKATVVEIKDNKIVLNQTVAFPEGGGQEGDYGVLVMENGEHIPFIDTQKGVGRVLQIPDFPSIQVETPVYHILDNEHLEKVHVGDKVIVRIDTKHRLGTTAAHSGLHIALMAATEKIPEKVAVIKGCSINDHSGRLDFYVQEKITPEEIQWVNQRANEIIQSGMPIRSYPHADEPEAWYWGCGNFVCACGGTHMKNTADVGSITVKKKSVGKTLDRMTVLLNGIALSEEAFH